MVRIYVYRYNTYTLTLTINIYKYNYMNPSIRLPDYINLTSSIRPQLDDYRIKTTTNYNQCHIHTHIHIQLHTHNHIFTMNLCNPITLLQPNFDINQLTKTTLSKRWPHIQNVMQTNAEIPTPDQSLTDFKRTAILIYIWAKFFSHIMRAYIGGGFRLAIMRVYICGKIFALHNTHIKTWRKSQNHNAKNCLESIKIFRQKCICVGDFKGFM